VGLAAREVGSLSKFHHQNLNFEREKKNNHSWKKEKRNGNCKILCVPSKGNIKPPLHIDDN
jgi:hypothetical protein